MATDSSQFVHRPNHDGTFDSICVRCFVTVATKFNEGDLEPSELNHDCDPKLLEWYRRVRQRSDS